MKHTCHWKVTVIGTLIVGGLFGCSSPSPLAAQEAPPLSEPRVTLTAGDEIEVKFFYTPQLNETQTVRPDGKMSFQLVGEIGVEGKAPAELREELLRLYGAHLNDPEIVVITRSSYHHRVFVGGQVNEPGMVEMPGELTLVQALMHAGGLNYREAQIDNVVVIRHTDTHRYGYSVNLKPVLEGEPSEPFLLQPQDIVYVPRTTIAEVNQWVDQYINGLIPNGFTYLVPVGDATIGITTRR